MATVTRKDTGEILFDGLLSDAKLFFGNGVMEMDRFYEENEDGTFAEDADGNPIVLEEGSEVELALNYNTGVKGEAMAYLKDTDWYVVREQETGIAMPVEVRARRSAIRAKF